MENQPCKIKLEYKEQNLYFLPSRNNSSHKTNGDLEPIHVGSQELIVHIFFQLHVSSSTLVMVGVFTQQKLVNITGSFTSLVSKRWRCPILVLSNRVATIHMWLLSSWNMARVEKLNFLFYLILSSHMWPCVGYHFEQLSSTVK